ncbi:MAG TPA: hypothetical protein VFA30_08295 [Gaiellaceae bacterium]|nr:hypothetical protein [Gaiellaceae bacterium]
MKVAALVLAAALAAAPVKVALTASGHAPKVNTRWHYTIRVTRAGKPVAARLTEVIVDPIGGKHPVDYGTTSKKIANWPFKGVFRDFLTFPAAARGVPVTWRITIKVGTTTRTVNYKLTPRA